MKNADPITRAEAENLYKELKYRPWTDFTHFIEIRFHPKWVDLCGFRGKDIIYLSSRFSR